MISEERLGGEDGGLCEEWCWTIGRTEVQGEQARLLFSPFLKDDKALGLVLNWCLECEVLDYKHMEKGFFELFLSDVSFL